MVKYSSFYSFLPPTKKLIWNLGNVSRSIPIYENVRHNYYYYIKTGNYDFIPFWAPTYDELTTKLLLHLEIDPEIRLIQENDVKKPFLSKNRYELKSKTKMTRILPSNYLNLTWLTNGKMKSHKTT